MYGKKAELKFNDISEISFQTYLYMDGETNPYYDRISEMKYILVPEIGFFCISSVTVNSEGTKYESKSVTARSYQCLLGQKYLEEFVINMGTTESIDGVSFYNLADKSKSLLHLVLEKCPDWKIGHIDTALLTMQRSFEVARQDVYSFLTTDISNAFGCIFLFDTLSNTIHIYKEENVGKDTNIHISYNNLLKSTNISSSLDDIKTCLTLSGSDDLNIREINMGFDRIYNFDYYHSTEFMSQSLYDAYNRWIALRNSKTDAYTTLLSQYQNYIKQINDLEHNKMPSTSGSTDWTAYGLVPLQEQLSSYEQQQSVMMKSGWGDSASSYYQTKYLPVYNAIQSIKAQLKRINAQLSTLKAKQKQIQDQMAAIISVVSMENNFTGEQLQELSTFIREDELSSDNYVVTDTMTDEERFAMLKELLAYGEKELAKAATPQLSFSSEILNLFALKEFDTFSGDFEPGNYIHISFRDDYRVKVRLLALSVNFHDASDFAVTFGNIVKREKNIFTDISDALSLAKSAATSVSFSSSYWNQASKDTDNINQMLDEGLLSSGKYLKSGDDSEMIIDQRGIFVNTTSGEYAGKDSIFIGGGRILFTDNSWKNVSMSVGRANIKGESRFGTFADFCIASYIAGSEIESSNLTTSTMTASTITSSTITSSDFNNGNGTFHVDSKCYIQMDWQLLCEHRFVIDLRYELFYCFPR